ncbi:MAG: hypothetical protein HW406_1549 [Candidatus Brocadiaceae bacterium]|nr:hypothetical protein [Candidatus Brocadiaceae bacterium]
MEDIIGSNVTIIRLLERLKGLTGFVSILGNDRRVAVFNRYEHILRVNGVTQWLCDQFKEFDRQSALLVSLLHDINRLPFAHNLEKEIGFDQAEDIALFFRKHDLSFDPSIVAGIRNMLKKEIDNDSLAKIVFTADSAVGFVEDPLFIITALGYDEGFIPHDISRLLDIDFRDTFIKGSIASLRGLFYSDPAAYMKQFNSFVHHCTVNFLIHHDSHKTLLVERKDFKELRHQLKNEFLRVKVYPINNEQVSQGSRLAREIGLPAIYLMKKNGQDSLSVLASMTDNDLLNYAYKNMIINEIESFFPHLPTR